MAGMAAFVRGWFTEPAPTFELRQPSARWGQAAPRQARRSLRVAEVIQETPSTRTFVLASPEGGPPAFSYRAGQHLTLLVDAGGTTHRRCCVLVLGALEALADFLLHRRCRRHHARTASRQNLGVNVLPGAVNGQPRNHESPNPMPCRLRPAQSRFFLVHFGHDY